MDKLKLSQWGERLKTGGAQMGRLVSDKMKEILQTPTPESKMVDEATSEMLEEPNWGMNLRICALINSEEFSGTEVVRAIKRKIGAGKSATSQGLSLDLLEACAMNCEKVFSEVASEKVLDEMVKMIEDPRTNDGVRDRAWQLIRSWGESEDLEYLPVFHQTYMSLKERRMNSLGEGGNVSTLQNSLESIVFQEPISPPESYPVPSESSLAASQNASAYGYGLLSVEDKNEFLSTTRNTFELLSSILNSETEPKPLKEDLTMTLLEECKHARPIIQRIIESTVDDEPLLFEALNLHDELHQVISKYKELESSLNHVEQQPESLEKTEASLPAQAGPHKNETARVEEP